MRAMQSSTALVEELDSIEVWGKGPSSSFAALQFVPRRRGGEIIDGAPGEVPAGNGQALVARAGVEAAHATGGRSEAIQTKSQGTVAEDADLAHDARNLLGALSLYADLLAAPGVLNEEYREYAGDLRLLSEQSMAIVERLVNFTRQQKASGEDSAREVTRTGRRRLVRAEAGWIAC